MSVKASCDTETTSAHLAGGRTTTIAVAAKHFLLAVRILCIATVQRSRIIFVGFILHVSVREVSAGFRETRDLHGYTQLLSIHCGHEAVWTKHACTLGTRNSYNGIEKEFHIFHLMWVVRRPNTGFMLLWHEERVRISWFLHRSCVA